KKLTSNTLVVFICDNGWIQDPQADRYAPRSKRSPYDGGLRTPIVLRWPGQISPRMADELASTIDLAPTILAAAGMKATADMTGINVRDDGAVRCRHTLYGEVFSHNAVEIPNPASTLEYCWVRDGDWKLIVPSSRVTPGEVELFDVAHDPREEKNL